MRRSILCVMVLSVSATGAAADQVTLKNGDRLTGTIVSGDGKSLLLKSELAGDVNIQWDAITAIESAQNLNLTLKDGSRLPEKSPRRMASSWWQARPLRPAEQARRKMPSWP